MLVFLKHDPSDEVIGHLFPRRTDQLMAEDNDDAIAYCIATGDVQKLVSFFSGRGQLPEALLIAQVETQTTGSTWTSTCIITDT